MPIIVRARNENIRGEARLGVIYNHCTLKFRRTSGYKGDFGFDWVREGDTDEPKNPWYYKEVMEPDAYENYLKEYDSFHQSWREYYPEYKASARYYAPFLMILPEVTAKLRMKLEVGRRSGKIKLKVTGSAASVVSINVTEVDAGKTGKYYDGQILEVECSGEFSTRSAIEATHNDELVGKIILPPNNPKRIKVALIPTKIFTYRSHYNKDIKEISEISGEIQRTMTILLKQLCIIPEFVSLEPVDLTKHTAKATYEKNFNKSGEDYPIFDTYFRRNSDRDIVFNGKSVGEREDQKYRGKNIYEYMFECLQEDNPQRKDLSELYKIYVFDNKGFDEAGIASKETKSAFLFPNGKTGVTATHELGHLLYLPHTFYASKVDNPIYKQNQKTTENIMDYGGGDRISFMYYQMRKAREKL